MGKLAKVCLFVVACLASLAAQAQVAVISGQVIDQTGQPLPYAQVRVCSVTSTGVPCNPTAPIFQDFGLTIPATNPWTTDQYGNYTVYAGTLPAPNLYTVQFSPASGITWAYVVNGPFLSAAGGIVSGYITALGYNQVAEVDQFSGVDFVAKLNTAYNSLPGQQPSGAPGGGVLDSRGFGATTQTSTTLMTALTNPSKPALVLVGPSTTFVFNEVYSPGKIASGVSTGVSGVNGACIVPIGQGSAIVNEGGNYTSFWRLGLNAQTYDFFCNAAQDGTQESFRVSGLAIIGNQSAPLPGALLHDRNTFVGTYIDNNYIDLPFGTAVRVEGGSDQMFFNNTIQDSSTIGGYPGSVLDVTCASTMQVVGGAIQFNGANNPLVTAQGTSPTMATSGCPLGANEEGLHFQGVDWEISPATVGSFSGHATNVDVIQCTDCSDFLIDKLFMFGNKGAGQQHVVDFLSSGNNGQIRGPVEVDNLIAAVGTQWSGFALITNTADPRYVSPTQQAVVGTHNGSTVGIGKYRWEGNGVTQASVTDYLDNEIVSTFQGLSTNGDINASLQAGADIGAKINAAITQCSAKCVVKVPPGTYPFTTTVVLPMNVFGQLTLSLDPGATLQYQGSGDAILTQITSNPTAANLLIEGGQLIGNVSATSGIHLKPSQKISIRNMAILQFSAGDGILNEGANVVNIYDNTIQNNQNGIHNISTFCNSATPVVCSPTFTSGQANSPNAMHVHDNTITVNSHWGIWEEWNGLAGSTGALNNIYRDNDLENNGFGVGNSAFGAIYLMKSVGDLIEGNYFEGSPHEVVLGQVTGGAGDFFAALAPSVRNNYFTTSPPIAPLTKSYNIELQNTADALIDGNTEQGTGSISNTTNCYINAATGGETRTLIGRNGIFQGQAASPTSGNPICIDGVPSVSLVGAGSGTFISNQYQSYMAFQNFQVNQAVTSETIAVQYLSANGSCDLRPVAQNTSATNNGRATLLAGTTYLTGLIGGGVTINHPSGQAITVDLYCTNNPNGGFGYP